MGLCDQARLFAVPSHPRPPRLQADPYRVGRLATFAEATEDKHALNWWPEFKKALGISAAQINHTAEILQILGAGEAAA